MTEKYVVDWGDGKTSSVDEKVFKFLQRTKAGTAARPKTLPQFWDLAQSIKSYDAPILAFYSFILMNHAASKSQLFQDLFVAFSFDRKRDGTFLEFGATDGLSLSNSSMLEHAFGWTGVLAEPSPQWHEHLRANRPHTKILTDCVYSESGKMLDYFVSDIGELSTLEDFRQSDGGSMAGNTAARNKAGYTTKVPTISLNDVFIRHFDSKPIDYMSVDTEGSELLILENFDFRKFGPQIMTVEHNYTENQGKLDSLLEQNDYRRVFREFSQFDAWYVKGS